jgi:hypothetical protein
MAAAYGGRFNGMYHARAADCVTGGEDLRIARLVIIHHNVTLLIELQPRILDQAPHEQRAQIHRQDNQVGKKNPFLQFPDFPVAILLDPFDFAAVKRLGFPARLNSWSIPTTSSRSSCDEDVPSYRP